MKLRTTQVPERTHDEHAAKSREYLRGVSPAARLRLDPTAQIALANTHATLALYELLRERSDAGTPSYMDSVIAARHAAS